MRNLINGLILSIFICCLLSCWGAWGRGGNGERQIEIASRGADVIEEARAD
jgi:hypothetical protein